MSTIVKGVPLCLAFLKVVTTVPQLSSVLCNDAASYLLAQPQTQAMGGRQAYSKVMGSTLQPLRSNLRGCNQA